MRMRRFKGAAGLTEKQAFLGKSVLEFLYIIKTKISKNQNKLMVIKYAFCRLLRGCTQACKLPTYNKMKNFHDLLKPEDKLQFIRETSLYLVICVMSSNVQAVEKFDREEISIFYYRKSLPVVHDESEHLTTTQSYQIIVKNNTKGEILEYVTGFINSNLCFLKINRNGCLKKKKVAFFLLDLVESYARANLCTKLYIVGLENEFSDRRYSYVFGILGFTTDTNRFLCSKKVTLNPGLDNKLFKYGKGNIMVLVGTATSGKTTIVGRLKGLYPNLVDYSIDKYHTKCLGKLIKKFNPEKYGRIAREVDIEEAVLTIFYGDLMHLDSSSSTYEDIMFLRSIYAQTQDLPKNQKDYLDLELSKFYGKVCRESQNGSFIVTDYPLLMFREVFWNLSSPLHFVHVFCPMKILSERTKLRNFNADREGVFSNKRRFEPFWQYAFYYKKKEYHDDVILEFLDKKVAEECFREHSPEPSSEKMYLFLHELGFVSADTVEVTYRFDPVLFLGETFTFVDAGSCMCSEQIDSLFRLCKERMLFNG